MAGNFFRGTSLEQDGRWGKSDEKLMAKMSKSGMFAPILDTKVNLKKINIDVISRWVTQKIIEIVGFEDDILINLVINMLQGTDVDGKKMQLDVTGFLEKQSGAFVQELWTLLVDAQEQPSGIPSAFIQKKKEEILNRQDQSKRWGAPPLAGAELSTKSTEGKFHEMSVEISDKGQAESKEVDMQVRKRERSSKDRSPSRDGREHRRKDEPRDRDHRDDRQHDRGDRNDRDRRHGDEDRRDRRDHDDHRSRSDRPRDFDRHSDGHRRRDSRDRGADRGRDRDSGRDRHNDDRRDRPRDSRRDGSRERSRDRHDSRRQRTREHSGERRRHRDTSPVDRDRRRARSPEHRSSKRSPERSRSERSPARRRSEHSRRSADRDHSVDRDSARPAKATKVIEDGSSSSSAPSRSASADRDWDQSAKLSAAPAASGESTPSHE